MREILCLNEFRQAGKVLLLPDGIWQQKQVYLGPDGSVWIPDFMKERFHHTSPGDFESNLLKLGTTKQRKDLG